jgi:hypothetical protein
LHQTLQGFDLRERIFQRRCAIVFAQIGGIERLFLRRDRRLQTEAIVVLCEPGVEGHGCQEHRE